MSQFRYRYAFIAFLSVFSFVITELCEVYFYFGIRIAWYHALLTIISITFLLWEGNRLAEPHFLKQTKRVSDKRKILVLFFVAGCIIAFLSVAAVVLPIGILIYHLTPDQLYNPIKLNLIYAFLINLLFHLINTIFFYFSEYRKHWKEAEELRRITAQAELQLMRNQIQPHFLFNNLNVLSGMVIKDNPDANRFIEKFATVYRYILNNQEKELVELQKELNFIEPYIFLLLKRFEPGLVVTVSVPEEDRKYLVIPAALQMLIENAIKHNSSSPGKPLHIQIHTNGGQTLVVKNNLQLRKAVEDSHRIGLQNIRQRYELISGRKVEISQTETSFEVALPLLTLNFTS